MTISSVDRFVNVEVALRTFSIVLNRPLLMVLELLASLQLLLEDTKRGELDAKDATDDVGSIENEETIDWETVKVLKVKLDIFDDERYKEEVRSAMKLVDVDVIAVDDSGEELISLKGILGETESVELVTTVEETASGVEGVAKKVVDWVEELPKTSDLAETVDLVKKSAALLEETTAEVKVDVADRLSVEEMDSSEEGPTKEVGSTDELIPLEVSTSMEEGISEEEVITLETISSLEMVI
ncbi:hypothetical protein AWRI1631_103330 [Saccharomyces cerevisiae AWRI1631]|uniref:Uncharacterized protein n=1 Tax=Saccharomyces cerevisiae (strain AWRI1631) TaxID=545124 RepID=B5VLT8_YEAS6|nr:hypothetical protein AWRI1631_103330 [Saccharomyces cerevisiae AWRI1631]